jgi:ribosomal-protein-alanine N-acetyltransferase
MRTNMPGKDASVTIRTAQRRDCDAIVAITEAVFAPVAVEALIEKMLGRTGGASWVHIKAEVIRNDLKRNPEGCFVAEIGGKVAGYVTTTINTLASRGIIDDLAVAADCQGRGIGRRLLETALAHFRSLGLKQAKIETLACNEVGQHLYPLLGFREVVRQIHYIMAL